MTPEAFLHERGLHGRIAYKGEKDPIQASRRSHIERGHAWQNAFSRLARCDESSLGGFIHEDAQVWLRLSARRSRMLS